MSTTEQDIGAIDILVNNAGVQFRTHSGTYPSIASPWPMRGRSGLLRRLVHDQCRRSHQQNDRADPEQRVLIIIVCILVFVDLELMVSTPDSAARQAHGAVGARYRLEGGVCTTCAPGDQSNAIWAPYIYGIRTKNGEGVLVQSPNICDRELAKLPMPADFLPVVFWAPELIGRPPSESPT